MDTLSKHQRIYATVRLIPTGCVATYGDVAALAGLPGHARLVGYALHALPEFTDVPWQRVINAQGGISLGRAYPGGELHQRHLLVAEGVEFNANGKIDLKRFRWQPSPANAALYLDNVLTYQPTPGSAEHHHQPLRRKQP